MGGGNFCSFSIKDMTNGALCGYTYLKDIDTENKSAFIGKVMIGNNDYRDGLTVFEAVRHLICYAFDVMKLNRIEGACMKEHYFTPFMLTAFGFKQEGLKRECVFKGQSYHDVLWYAMLQSYYIRITKSGEMEIGKVVRRCTKLIKNSRKR